MYGATINPGSGMTFMWDGVEWTPTGVGDAFANGGNATGAPMRLGTLDGNNLIVQAGLGASTTGSLYLTAQGEVEITGNNGAGNPDVVVTSAGTAPTAGALIQSYNGNVALQAGTEVDLTAATNIVLTPGPSPVHQVTIAAGASPHAPVLAMQDVGGGNQLSVKAPDALGGSTQWTLPTGDAANVNTAPTSDGAGNLSFNQGSYVSAKNQSGQVIPSGPSVNVGGWVADSNIGPVVPPFNLVSGVFTAPVTGFYRISAQIRFDPIASAPGTGFSLQLATSSGEFFQGESIAQIAGAISHTIAVTQSMPLGVGETVSVLASQGSGGPAPLTPNFNWNFFSAELIK